MSEEEKAKQNEAQQKKRQSMSEEERAKQNEAQQKKRQNLGEDKQLMIRKDNAQQHKEKYSQLSPTERREKEDKAAHSKELKDLEKQEEAAAKREEAKFKQQGEGGDAAWDEENSVLWHFQAGKGPLDDANFAKWALSRLSGPATSRLCLAPPSSNGRLTLEEHQPLHDAR